MSIEAMKQALEALECIFASTHPYRGDESTFTDEASVLGDKAITSLRQAIEQAEKQEPVAVIRTWHKMGEQHAELWNWHTGLDALPDGEHTLYTTPQPQREWVGLTDEEIDGLVANTRWHELIKATEAKLKEKNT